MTYIELSSLTFFSSPHMGKRNNSSRFRRAIGNISPSNFFFPFLQLSRFLTEFIALSQYAVYFSLKNWLDKILY